MEIKTVLFVSFILITLLSASHHTSTKLSYHHVNNWLTTVIKLSYLLSSRFLFAFLKPFPDVFPLQITNNQITPNNQIAETNLKKTLVYLNNNRPYHFNCTQLCAKSHSYIFLFDTFDIFFQIRSVVFRRSFISINEYFTLLLKYSSSGNRLTHSYKPLEIF